MFPLVRAASFTAVNPNDVRGPDKETQIKTYAGPMIVDEIRFRATTDSGAAAADSPLVNFRIELKLGTRRLVNWVPAGALFRLLDPLETASIFGSWSEVYGAGFGVWKPRSPIFVPAGVYLTPQVWHAHLNGSTRARTVSIAYVGRALPPGTPTPPRLKLPWATSYVGGSQSTDFAIESKATDLFNPGPEILRVERLVGMSLGLERSPRDVFNAVTLRMSDSLGNGIVRSRTPWVDVFNVPDQNWDLPQATLPTNAFYKVLIDGRLTGLSTTFNPCIALVGEHEVNSTEI